MSSPFSSGGSSTSSSSATANNQTTVNVQSSTDLSVDTSDLATAIQTLAGSQQQAAEETAALNFLGTQTQAQAQVQAAQIAAGAGPSWSTILIVAAAILGLLFTAGAIKLPRGLRA